jgi:hypothetical protein
MGAASATSMLHFSMLFRAKAGGAVGRPGGAGGVDATGGVGETGGHRKALFHDARLSAAAPRAGPAECWALDRLVWSQAGVAQASSDGGLGSCLPLLSWAKTA